MKPPEAAEIFKLKAATLLHDPPHKPYLIKKHEEEAKRLAKEVLGKEISGLLYDDRVKLADKISSTIDRWILSLLMSEKYVPGLFPENRVSLKNIFEPMLEVEDIGNRKLCDEAHVHEGYAMELGSHVNKVGEWRLKYHLLYAFYELLWIHKNLPIGPADTRIPTHTVFDHDYASAAIINWLLEEKRKINGLLVGLDVASVQEFIAASRKLRDMWVSSYIVSALTWYTIVELVEKLGPDIVIMPSMRMNPFYMHWLMKQRWVSEDIRKLMNELKELIYLSDDIKRMYDELGMPPYPIIPGRVTLILPPWSVVKKLVGTDKDSLEEYLNNRFKKGWKLLWRIAERYAEKLAGSSRDVVWEFVRRVIKQYHNDVYADTAFHEIPPLKLRVAYVKVEEGVGAEVWRLYDAKYRELVSKLAVKKYVRESASTELNLHELTRKAFDKDNDSGIGFPKASKRGFDYCTSCGKHPALLILPREHDEYEEKIKAIVGRDTKRDKIMMLTSIFSPGEKICPWCLLKRVIGLEPRLLEALILGIKEDEVEEFLEELCRNRVEKGGVVFTFPSTAHVASARLYEKILSLDAEKLVNLLKSVKLNEHIPLKLSPNVKRKRIWRFMDKLAEKFEDIASPLGEEERAIAFTIFNLDPEDTWFSVERRNVWLKLLSSYNLNVWLWRYYALIIADGDSIGDLLEGKLTAFMPGKLDSDFYYKLNIGKLEEDEKRIAENFLIRYIKNACKGKYSEFIVECLKVARGDERKEIVVKKWAEYIAKNTRIIYDEALEYIRKVIEALRSILKELKIPVSPTYHVTLSAALMRAALLDASIIANNDGFVVYVGGDDLLAFAPVDKSLNIVYDTRLSFGGLKKLDISSSAAVGVKPGFVKIKESYLSMLSNIGRSYSLYIAHYHYPLSVVLTRASKLLEEAKSRYIFEYCDEGLRAEKSVKDILVVAYCPRGEEEATLIPLTWSRPILKDSQNVDVVTILCGLKAVMDMLACVDERIEGRSILSHSILYDFIKSNTVKLVLGLRELLLKDPDNTISTLTKLIKHVIERNIRKGVESEALEEVWKNVFEPLLSISKKGYRVEGLGVIKNTLKRDNVVQDILLLNIIKATRLVRSGMR